MRSNKTLIFIGTIKKVANCGESMKNHLFIERFREVFDKVITVDVYRPMKHPLNIVKTFFILLLHRHDKVVLSVSPATANKFLKMMTMLKCDNVFYWAVGISLVNFFKNERFEVAPYKRLKAIYVQSPHMVESLKDMGLTNVQFVPNSKPIPFFPELKNKNNSLTRFVFFSRMDPTKGCEMILRCADRLYSEGYRGKFMVHFYGLIDDNKKQWFELFSKQLKASPVCSYNGFLTMNKEGYETLSTYDVMLFPTFYIGEAFPGVLIDCFIAGVPIVASDWHFNKDIIDDSTGIIIPAKSEDALFQTMKDILDGKVDLQTMARSCQQEAHKYDNHEVLSVANLERIGFLDCNA